MGLRSRRQWRRKPPHHQTWVAVAALVTIHAARAADSGRCCRRRRRPRCHPHARGSRNAARFGAARCCGEAARPFLRRVPAGAIQNAPTWPRHRHMPHGWVLQQTAMGRGWKRGEAGARRHISGLLSSCRRAGGLTVAGRLVGVVAFRYERQASDGGSGGLCVMRAGAAQATVPRQSGPRRWRCHAGEENRATEAGRVAVHTAYADPAAARRGPEGYIHGPASGPPRSAGGRERGFAASAGLEPHPSVARTTYSPGGGGGGDGG